MKFFVISDVHGFYEEMRQALFDAGFDRDNEEHWLIGLGDYLDRGRQPQDVISYLMGLPRKILVKGNHECLLLDMIDRGYALSHDWSNGTADTVLDLAPNAKTFDVACAVAYDKVKDFINSMVDYVELKHYIGVHSFIPLKCNDKLPMYYIKNRNFEYMQDWRNASVKDWEQAKWGNPFSLAEQGLNKTGKTLIWGHWSTEHKWAKVECRKEFDKNAKFEPYYGDGYIGIDGTTAYSGKINVVIIEDEFMGDADADCKNDN